MKNSELKSNLTAVRAELERLTSKGVSEAKSIVGMANVLDQCIASIKEDDDRE